MSKPVRISYLLLGLAALGSIAHNLLYTLLGREEVISFIITAALLLGFLISVLVNVITYFRSRQPHDIWRLGWLGVLGVFGFVLHAPRLYVLFALYVFFGFRPR